MSAEYAAADYDRDHRKSTISLVRLLADAVSEFQASLCWSSIHVLGELVFTVSSNDVKAAEFLTHCLLPAETKEGIPPSLEIFVLTGTSHPFALPPPWNLPHTDPRHLERLHLSPDGRVSAFYDHDRQFWMILDKDSGRALLWIAQAESLPFWEEAAPFKQILQWFFVGTRMSMLHGGVISNSRCGALLAGAGGSGKSTTVAACFQAGLGVCGDDLMVVERSNMGWSAHAVYDAVKLSPNDAIPTPPILEAAPWRACGEKRLVRYTDASANGFFRTTRLNALIHCMVTGRAASRLASISPSEMLRAIGPPTVFLLRGREAHILKEVNELIRALPCFRLELGGNPAEAALLLKDWLEGLADD